MSFLVFCFSFSRIAFFSQLTYRRVSLIDFESETEQVFPLNNLIPRDKGYQALPNVNREQICNQN